MILTASYADDNTIYCSDDCVSDVVASLSKSAKKLFRWFSVNRMKGSTDKCHLTLSKERNAEIRVGESLTKNSTCVK